MVFALHDTSTEGWDEFNASEHIDAEQGSHGHLGKCQCKLGLSVMSRCPNKEITAFEQERV